MCVKSSVGCDVKSIVGSSVPILYNLTVQAIISVEGQITTT